MPKAYPYERFSSPEQAEGDSSRRQKSGAELWSERTGIELDRDLALYDHGRSGFRGAQFTEGALGRFVEKVRSGEIAKGSYLLIENIDRFSRENPLMASSRLFELINMGIVVVTTGDGLEYSEASLSGTDIGRLLTLMLHMSRSHLESREKSIRVGDAWAEKKARARLGQHKVSARCPEWLTLVDGAFVEREGRFEIVRSIFRQTIDGAGRGLIARRLNERGILPFKHGQKRKVGRPPPQGWHPSAIAKILNNHAVRGIYQPGKGSHKFKNYEPDGDPIPDYYPRIVSEDDFWNARRASQGRRQGSSGRRGNRGAHILRGLCRCGACDGPMHVKNKGRPPKGAIYLVCSSADRKAGCTMVRRWRLDRLEPAVLRAFGFVAPAALSEVDGGVPKAIAAVQALEAKVADADSLRQWLLEAGKRTRDAGAMDAFEEQVKVVSALKADLKRAKAEAATLMADPGVAERLANAVALSRRLEEANDDERLDLRIRINETLKGLVEHIRFDGDTGAVMVLKPMLGLQPQDGIVPYATRMVADDEGQMLVSVLVDDDATESQMSRFLDFPDDVERWLDSA